MTANVFYDASWGSKPYRCIGRLSPEQDGVLFESDDGRDWDYHSVIFNNGDAYSIPWSIFNDGSQYVMMYVGPNGGSGEKIGIATSDDLITWTDQGYPTDGATGIPANVDCFFASGGAKVGNTYYWFLSEGEGEGWPRTIHQIALYTSSEVASGWTRQKTILEPGSAGAWDDVAVWDADVVWSDEDNKWVMIYVGCDVGTKSDGQIGLASSDTIDGTYTKYGSNPVLSETGSYPVVDHPAAFKTPGGAWVIFHSVHNGDWISGYTV